MTELLKFAQATQDSNPDGPMPESSLATAWGDTTQGKEEIHNSWGPGTLPKVAVKFAFSPTIQPHHFCKRIMS